MLNPSESIQCFQKNLKSLTGAKRGFSFQLGLGRLINGVSGHLCCSAGLDKTSAGICH